MAETADILANRPEQLARRGGGRVSVVLPDLAAGCSMADMAEIDQVEDCWQQLAAVIDTAEVMPVTYVNSAASLKAFCGATGGSSARRPTPGRFWSGRSPSGGACCSFPISTWDATRP